MLLTEERCASAEALLSDIFINSQIKPYTLTASPVPELPEAVKKAIVQALRKELSQGLLSRDGLDKVAVMEAVQQYTATARYVLKRQADRVAADQEKDIQDVLLRAGWVSAFRRLQADMITYPGAIVQFPVVQREKRLKYDGGQAVVADVLVEKIVNISPFDAYPSPDMVDPQTGEYIIVVKRYTANALLAAGRMGGFAIETIREQLKEHPEGYKRTMYESSEREQLETGSVRTAVAPGAREYEVLEYWGRVPGPMLKTWGVPLEGDEELKDHEACIWVLEDDVIMAKLNPDKMMHRPFYKAVFEQIPGAFWGKCIPMLMADIQDICDAAVRALVRNMAVASAPMGEYDASRLDDTEDIKTFEPFKLFKVNNDFPGAGPAIKWHTIPVVITELMTLYDKFEQKADAATGIPRYSYGNVNQAGLARSAAGLQTLLGAATKRIKNVVRNIEDSLITPMVEHIWQKKMLETGKPHMAVGDIEVIVRGASGLLERENKSRTTIEFLQFAGPMLQGLPPEKQLEILARVAAQMDVDMSGILPDPDFARAAGQDSNSGAGTPPPQLPGNSAPLSVPGTAPSSPLAAPAGLPR